MSYYNLSTYEHGRMNCVKEIERESETASDDGRSSRWGRDDVHPFVEMLTVDAIQAALGAELENELVYSKYDYKNKGTDNSRNGELELCWWKSIRPMYQR